MCGFLYDERGSRIGTSAFDEDFFLYIITLIPSSEVNTL